MRVCLTSRYWSAISYDNNEFELQRWTTSFCDVAEIDSRLVFVSTFLEGCTSPVCVSSDGVTQCALLHILTLFLPEIQKFAKCCEHVITRVVQDFFLRVYLLHKALFFLMYDFNFQTKFHFERTTFRGRSNINIFAALSCKS